jgi:hypothetical protein
MNWHKFRQGLGALALALIPTVVAPWVNAVATSTPLNGVPGIVRFWNGVIHRNLSFELWQAVVILAAIAGFVFAARAYRKRHTKTSLSIVVMSLPPPQWNIGAYGKTPVMFTNFQAQLAHTGPHSLKIVKVYLKGTKCVASFPSFVVAGPYDEPVQIHTGVRPILSNGKKRFTRRVILVDQFGNKHQTEPICFESSPSPVPHALTPMGCHFCGQPVAMEDLAESASLFAHKSCVR